MRVFAGLCCSLLLLAIGGTGDAVAACCVTVAPVHVYVPPPSHVVVVPHTTYVRPVTPQVHPHTSTNTLRSTASSSTPAPQAVHAKRTPTSQTVVVVDNQPAATSKRCAGKGQGADGCKKKEDESGWATVRRWLQIGKK
jgi:hypothetical protein